MTPEQNDDKTTCLIIGLLKEGDNDATYFRVNINPQLTGQYLKRNNVYQVTITAVNGEGADNETEAYQKGKLLLDTSINSWDRDEDGLIIRDGDNLMAIPTRRTVFSPEAEKRQFYVYTLGNGTLELHKLEMPSGMDAWLEGNNLFIEVTAYTYSQRKGSIELRFAGMKGVIEIIQTGEKAPYLSLSRTNLPAWPNKDNGEGILDNELVKVSSSGPWTATIYGDNFTFRKENPPVTELKGTDGVDFNLFVTGDNNDEKTAFGFVLIALDSDPDNYRNVIVLNQAGTGGFTIYPANNIVRFNANGELSSGGNNVNTFTVRTGSITDKWTAKLTDEYPMSGKFKITHEGGSESVTGDGKFTVEATGQNFDGPATAWILIEHTNDNNEKTYKRNIEVQQDSYGLTVTPTSISGIASSGGISIPITVNSPLENGTFTATVSSNVEHLGLIPTLISNENKEVTGITGQPVNTSFQVKMPGINQHLTVQPQATVTITLDGTTSLEEKVIVTQNEVTYIPLQAVILKNTYGGWHTATYKQHFNIWEEEMVNTYNFGPNANSTVYTQSKITYELYSKIKEPTTNRRIIIINNLTLAEANVNKFPNINWTSVLKDDKVIFLVTAFDALKNFELLGFNENSYKIEITNRKPTATIRRIYPQAKVINPSLWDFLFDGPFGQLNYEDVSLINGDNIYSYLTAYPDTFVPLIMNPDTNDPVLGIDPENRIIWIGDDELFSTYLGARSNYAVQNSANHIFLRNLIAWMVHVNNYGDAFTKQFIRSDD